VRNPMKLFKQLLVAPAALGLLAPLAATAAEVNINDVAGYTNESTQAVSAAQFSDVVPGDWAYTALQNLSESYGCVDNAYTQNLKSGQALTRYEAAALVNACLDGGVASVNSEDLSRLTNEFGTEMAILKGRVDGLEYKAPEFNAGQFSSSTKLNGEATFQLGGISYESAPATETGEAIHAKYAFVVDMSTSFTGEDALIAGFEAGNDTAAGRLETESSAATANAVNVESLYYTFPVGDFTIAAGPLLDQDDLISTTTSTYSNDFLFSARYLGPNGFSMHGETGAGIAAAFTSDSGWNVSLNSITSNADTATTGLFTEESFEMATLSVGYDGDNWGGGLIYTAFENPEDMLEEAGEQTLDNWTYDNPYIIGLGAYWQATDDFDISLGVDFINPEVEGATDIEDAATWSIGADWDLGPGTLSAAMASVPAWNLTTGDYDSAGTSYEMYYDYQINDGVSIMPGFYTTAHDDRFVDHTVYAVETTFKF